MPRSDRPLKILMLNDYGRPSGGAELQMLALRDGLRARGHKVRLMTSDAELAPGFPLLADRTCKGRTDIAQVATHTVNPSAWRALRRELREFPPDVVHIRMFLYQLSPIILPLLRRVPVLFQAAVYKAVCPNGLKLLPDGTACGVSAGRVCRTNGCVAPKTWAATMTQLAMVRRWRAAIDLPSALSRRMADIFEQNGWPPMAVIPNGVDDLGARGPLEGPPLIVYAGRLSREKGLDTLIDAFGQASEAVPGAELHIAGTGPLEDDLRAKARPLGPRVRFLGHLPREEMERHFRGAWVQAVPSLWHEPFGNVTTEAMMRGTAVLASDVGGQSDIVEPGRTGDLLPPGDVAQWRDALVRVLSDRTLADTYGRNGRDAALSRYSRDAALDTIEARYVEAMTRHADASRREP